MTPTRDQSLVSPFTIRHDDRFGLHTSRGFRILRNHLEENVDSTFCTLHSQPTTSHPTWLLHRAILHALIAPLVALYRRAEALAAQTASHPVDLELAFQGEARDAFVWMQAFVETEGDWCAGAGCPGCNVSATTQDEGMIRLVLAGLDMAEQEGTESKSSSPEQRDESSYPFPNMPGKAGSDHDKDEIPFIVNYDTATESEDNDDVSESDFDLCRASTTSSLATSIAGSPYSPPSFLKTPASPLLLPQRRTALAPAPPPPTSAPPVDMTALETEGRPTLPSLKFFRTSLLQAVAKDDFFSLSDLTSRAHVTANGLRALIDACREIETTTVVVPSQVEQPTPEAATPQPQEEQEQEQEAEPEEEDDEEVPIDLGRFKWVDEKDLLEARRRRNQDLSPRPAVDASSDAEDEASADEQDEEDDQPENDDGFDHHHHGGEAALNRVATGWAMRQVWVRAALGQVDVRERRRLMDAVEERAGKLRAYSSRDRRRRGFSWGF